EGDSRKDIIEADLVDCIVGLPAIRGVALLTTRPALPAFSLCALPFCAYNPVFFGKSTEHRPMASLKYVKPERIHLHNHPEFNERWVQERIAEDPSLLGLGELIVKDKERAQPRAGRLDLLCQDADSNHRYEIEIQLGKTDESHIIRTIEYRDIERKRYPQYDHVAVIVAEEITSRFLNVIALFNGLI